MISGARGFLPAYRDRCLGATNDERIAILFRLSVVTGVPEVLRNGSQTQQQQFWQLYHDVLWHIPAEVLERAGESFLRTARAEGSQWFPAPGVILATARLDDAWRYDVEILTGLRRIARASPINVVEPDPFEEEQVAAKLKAFYERREEEAKSELSGREEAKRIAFQRYLTPQWTTPEAKAWRSTEMSKTTRATLRRQESP